jgi:hypothetical protein
MSRLVRSVSLLALLAFTAGCGGGREFAGVEGTVTLDGKPIADVRVMFVPDALKGNKGNTAEGVTDAQGRYRLRAGRDEKDGTVLGVHRVFFVDTLAYPGSGKKPRFPDEYSEALQTPYQDIDVKPGHQTLDFNLKSKGGRGP